MNSKLNSPCFFVSSGAACGTQRLSWGTGVCEIHNRRGLRRVCGEGTMVLLRRGRVRDGGRLGMMSGTDGNETRDVKMDAEGNGIVDNGKVGDGKLEKVGAPNVGSKANGVNVEMKWKDYVRLFDLFRRLATPYFEREKEARLRFGGVLALTLLQSGIAVTFSYVSKDFWTALGDKNAELFMHQAELFLVALAVATPVSVWYRYTRKNLAMKWREWMTRKVLEEYFQNRSYYQLDQNTQMDNPDQRIAQDLTSFTSKFREKLPYISVKNKTQANNLVSAYFALEKTR